MSSVTKAANPALDAPGELEMGHIGGDGGLAGEDSPRQGRRDHDGDRRGDRHEATSPGEPSLGGRALAG